MNGHFALLRFLFASWFGVKPDVDWSPKQPTKVGKWLRNALVRGFQEEPIRVRMSGGSIPISPFVNTLEIPAVTVPTVNRDNNQHSPNETIRPGDYRNGIKTILAVLTEKL